MRSRKTTAAAICPFSPSSLARRTTGGLLGELAYLTQRLLGGARCALCAITHDASNEKPEFRDTRRSFPLPLQTLHRNEQSPALRGITEGRTPCVVGETADGFELLIDRSDHGVDRCRVTECRDSLSSTVPHGAIEVLPEEVAQQPDSLARFERGARLLAALDHPRIATLSGMEDGAGQPFLAIELVAGETLGQRIAQTCPPCQRPWRVREGEG